MMKALLIGVPIWGALLFVCWTLCCAAAEGDRQNDEAYRRRRYDLRSIPDECYSEWEQ
jgi:hypothetical protein